MKRPFIIIFGALLMVSCGGKQPLNIGVANGLLTPCPAKPNCVSSQVQEGEHHVSPISYQGSKADAMGRIKKILGSWENTQIVSEAEDYLHVEFISKIMGFVDDVELYFPDEPLIHVRSASRLGRSDFGVNRKRVERLRRLINQ